MGSTESTELELKVRIYGRRHSQRIVATDICDGYGGPVLVYRVIRRSHQVAGGEIVSGLKFTPIGEIEIL